MGQRLGKEQHRTGRTLIGFPYRRVRILNRLGRGVSRLMAARGQERPALAHFDRRQFPHHAR